MISGKEIKEKSERKYKLFLQSIIKRENIFPLEIISNKKASKQAKDFKKELEKLNLYSKAKQGFGYTIDYTKRKTRTLGVQSFPSKIYFETEVDFVKFLKKEKEVAQFKIQTKKIIDEFPELQDWIHRFPKKIIDNLSIIDDLLKICRYFKRNPQPQLYIRELPIKVHTKFIEQNKGTLKQLLDIIIDGFVNVNESKFEKRFHLQYAEPLIRFRILDQSITDTYFGGVNDLSIPISQFQDLQLPIEQVIIVENKMNLLTTALTLPQQPKAIAIFGKGFQVSNLKNVKWLNDVEILYWGDIDVHGFEILSQLRGYFIHTQSIMMDSQTFDTFFEGDKGTLSKVAVELNLGKEEQVIYNRVKKYNYRLEQEKIPLEYVKDFFEKI